MPISFFSNGTIATEKLPEYKEFANSTFYEPVDVAILKLLATDARIHPSSQAILTGLIAKVKKGRLHSTHIQKVRCYERGISRFYPKNDASMTTLSRKIKHTMFQYMGWQDIDMKVGHPSIAVSIGDMCSLNLPAIKEYIASRPRIIQEVSEYYSMEGEAVLDTEDVKMLFNLTIYGGGMTTWRNNIRDGDENKDRPPKKLADKPTHPFVQRFITDRNLLMDFIFKKNTSLFEGIKQEYPEMTEAQALHKNKRTLMSAFFGIIENHCLYMAFKFLKKNKVINFTTAQLEYDGMGIPPNELYKLDEQMVNKLNQQIVSETGLSHICFTMKKYSDVLWDVIDKRKAMEGKDDVGGCVRSDKEAAERLFQLYPHWVSCAKELWVFDDSTGLWMNDKTTINKVVSRYSDDLHIANPQSGEKSDKSYGNTKSMRDSLIAFLPELCANNNWIVDKQTSSLGYVLYNNGYYNSATMEFITEFNPDIVFHGKIYQDWREHDSEEQKYMADVKQRMFYTPLGQKVADYMILYFALALMGIRLKKFFFLLGNTNCGKSKLTLALMRSLGDYVGIFNAENLSFSNSSADEGQKMRWALLLQHSRIIISNEVKIENEVKMNGNMIKKLSGGDPLVGRTHGKEEVSFIPTFLPVCCANDMAEIAPYDNAVDARLRVMGFNKTYVENPTEDDHLKMDENLDAEIETKRFQRAFLGIFIETYQKYKRGELTMDEPEEVKASKANWIGDDNDLMSRFQDQFEITNSKEDFTASCEMSTWLTKAKLGASQKKMAIDLQQHCKRKRLNNVASGTKWVNRVKTRGWYGVMKIVPIYGGSVDFQGCLFPGETVEEFEEEPEPEPEPVKKKLSYRKKGADETKM